MKSFLQHIKEEVLPTVQVADGGLDIEKPAVRAAINAAIAGVVSQPAVTPYVVFNRLSKLLAQYHIVLPRKFLEGDKGVEVFEIRQFGHRMGMTDSGEFINQVPTTHYLFLQYGIITPMGVTYAKPLVGGMFRVTARLVDRAELDRLIDMAEITMSEEAECMQAIAKANAPKEAMKDVTDDPKKVGNKKAVATSEKKSLDEERKRSSKVATAFMQGQKANERTLRTDGKSVTYHGNTIASHEGEHVHVTTAGFGHSPSTRGHVNSILRRLGSPTVHVKKGQLHHGDTPIDSDHVIKVKKSSSDTVSEDKDPCWKGYEMVGMKKKGGRKVPNCVPTNEEIRVNKWADGSHTARVSKDGKVLGVHTRKKYSDLNKEIKSRFGLKGNIPQGEEPGKAKTHQIDEVSHGRLKDYKDEREKDVKVTGISASHSEDMAKHHKVMGNEKKRKEFGDEAKWLRGKQKKMEKGIELADKKMKGHARINANKETLDEVSLATAAKTARQRNIGAERDAHASPYDYSPHIDVLKGKAYKTLDRIERKHGEGTAKKIAKKMNKDTDDVWRGKYDEETLDERLTKKMPASDVISDFVHSKAKTFEGDTKKKRISRALGAYYGMHPEKSKK